MRPDPRINAATLLVPIGDAALIGASLAVCDRFAFAWDIAEFPHQELIEFARWISAERLIDRGSFAGIFPYATGPIEPVHEKRIKDLLAPLLSPGASVSITIVP